MWACEQDKRYLATPVRVPVFLVSLRSMSAMEDYNASTPSEISSRFRGTSYVTSRPHLPSEQLPVGSPHSPDINTRTPRSKVDTIQPSTGSAGSFIDFSTSSWVREPKHERAKFSEKRRAEVAKNRKKGACMRCRLSKIPVSDDGRLRRSLTNENTSVFWGMAVRSLRPR